MRQHNSVCAIHSEINKCAIESLNYTYILHKHELANQNGSNVLLKIVSYISGMWENKLHNLNRDPCRKCNT